MNMIEYKGDILSHLSLGTVQLGMDYGIANREGKPSVQKACDILSAVIDGGINCFDTALAYGESEKILGECINKEVYIISKISSNEFGRIEAEVKASLHKLKQKRLFGLLLHDSKILSSWSSRESEKIARLKESGLIKHFGISIYGESEFEQALGIEDIELIQVPSNMIDNRLVKNHWAERAKDRSKLLFIRSIYLQGVFFLGSKALPDYLRSAKDILTELENISDDLNVTLSELALSYIKSVASESVILFGAESKEQAIENIELFEEINTLPQEIIDHVVKIANGVDESIYNPSLWRRQ